MTSIFLYIGMLAFGWHAGSAFSQKNWLDFIVALIGWFVVTAVWLSQ